MTGRLSAVYPTRGTGDLVHLYTPGYIPPGSIKRRRPAEATLCNQSITGTTKAPRELGLPKRLVPPFRYCALCVGRWVEHTGELNDVMRNVIALEQAIARAAS